MHVKFLNRGSGSAGAAVEYLLQETNAAGKEREEVEVLRGDPRRVAPVFLTSFAYCGRPQLPLCSCGALRSHETPNQPIGKIIGERLAVGNESGRNQVWRLPTAGVSFAGLDHVAQHLDCRSLPKAHPSLNQLYPRMPSLSTR